MDRANGSTDLPDMAFISPNVAKHDIQFQKGEDLGSDHLLIEFSIDVPSHRNSSTNLTSTNLIKLTETYSNLRSRLR